MFRYWWIILAVAAVGGGGWYWRGSLLTAPSKTDPSAQTLNSANGDQKQPVGSSATIPPISFTATGTKIAANYYQYSSADYQAARSASRPIFLYFYANWCPTCAEQEPRVVIMMNDLADSSQVIAFRVNFNDSETDDQEKKLAEEFGVRYQHTMFVLNGGGQTIKKFLGKTSNDDLLAAFKQAR